MSIRRIDLQYTREKAGQVPIGPDRPSRGCPAPSGYAFDAERFARGFEPGLADRGARLAALVLPMAPANPVPASADDAAFARALASDPVFQLR